MVAAITASDFEADAHLFALGIGSDARGTSVLLIGHRDAPLTKAFAAKLETFGARVRWDYETMTDQEMSVDYVIALPGENAVWEPSTVAANVLKPGGRYMVLVDRVADGTRDVELTDVRQVGDSQVRMLGWKRRVAGGQL